MIDHHGYRSLVHQKNSSFALCVEMLLHVFIIGNDDHCLVHDIKGWLKYSPVLASPI